MNKKILSWIVLAMLAFTLSAFADTLPNFPMSIWWTVKNGTTSITSGTVQVYNGLTKVWEIAVWSNWQYGWNTAFDQKITLTEFTWSLNYKLITWWLTYNLTSSGITKINSTNCSANTNITFVSEVCQYDLNLDSTAPTCDPTSVTNWLVNSTTCAITCNSWYNLSWNSCVIQSTWGSSSWGSSSWGSSYPIVTTCLDSQLECKLKWTKYVFYRKTWISCEWWNLTKSCEIPKITATWALNIDKSKEWNIDKSLFEWIKNIKSTTDSKWITSIEKADWNIVKLSDISGSFAKEFIDKLVTVWIFKWYDDGTFRPEKSITRGEFLWVIMKTFNINVDDNLLKSTNFSDIEEDSWIIKYAEKAREFWISDKTNTFRPNDSITRAESLAIIFKIWNLSTYSNNSAKFNDLDIEEWMNKYIDTAYEMWLVKGSQIDWKSYFKPNNNITRAEASVIIVRLLEKIWK